ncbi:MAG TPA: nitrate- and nitrite sensing domain-containing protein [Pseudonocardiaceae bacterium]|nr:nitrate- and nitrite sensing domain-containing protein [Pseudonocardiaceae bacterium]
MDAASRPAEKATRDDRRPKAAGHRRGQLATLVRPANWRVRTKVGAVLVLPAAAFAVLAGVQTAAAVRDATALDNFADQVAFGREVTGLVHELQRERDHTVGELARINSRSGMRDANELAGAFSGERKAVDAARQRLDKAVRSLPLSGTDRQVYNRASAALADVAQLRIGAESGWLRQRAVFDGYSRAIDALLAMLPEPAAAPDARLVSQVRGYADLARAKELSAQVRGQLFAVLHGQAALGAAELEELVNLRAQRSAALDQFRADATPYQVARYDEKVRGQTVRSVARLEQSIMEQVRGTARTVAPAQWWTDSTRELELLREVEATLLNEAVEGTQELSAARWRVTGLATAGILLVLLVALMTSVLIGSSMVRSLRLLRTEALDVAQRALPEALRRLRNAPSAGEPAIEVAPMSVRTADEVGDVADAFTAVHRSVVRLAVEQATMRRNVNAMFVNFARRSQLLVERQLELLDNLELEEDDPDQLANLFRLDHLAARMRRNDENLLVLAGSDTGRRWSEPVALPSVVLAAIAEVEQYTRVRHEIAGDLHVVGHAVADIVHLLSELLDNATAFSPPSAQVRITGQTLDGGREALVQVADEGIGMSDKALREANALLAAPPPVDVAASERMGLFVVSYLAARHRIRVELQSRATGVLAVVRLPKEVLAPAPATALPRLASTSAPVSPAPVPVPAAAAAPGEPSNAPGEPSAAVPPPRRRRAGTSRRHGVATRAEDVLGGGRSRRTKRAAASVSGTSWWSRQAGDAPAAPERADRAPQPPPADPVSGGTSSQGLPIRVPMARLATSEAGAAGASPAGHAPGGEPPDPGAVSTTLSRFYGGVHRAEVEDSGDGTARQRPAAAKPAAMETAATETGGAKPSAAKPAKPAKRGRPAAATASSGGPSEEEGPR